MKSAGMTVVADVGQTERVLLDALCRCKRSRHSISIVNCIPTLVEPDPRSTLNILRTTFETDRIPDGWLERIEAFDEVWVISKHNEQAFRRSGVAPEKMRVVPSCLDIEKFDAANRDVCLTGIA